MNKQNQHSIDPNRIPRHIAVIMDGNGRWASQRGNTRTYGHQRAIHTIKQVVEGCGEIGVHYLTLFAFSTENWGRPTEEVNAIMTLLVETIQAEQHLLIENQVKLIFLGNEGQLPKTSLEKVKKTVQLTHHNKGLQVILALSYSGRWEILRAVKKIAQEIAETSRRPEDIDESYFSNFLQTAYIPDPELLIRTGGEQRISNFLLWQLAYTELYFTPTLWPDFRKEHLYEAIIDYQKRDRRFGLLAEQLL